MEIKTWADFGALSKEELDSYIPEDLESLKSSIAINEAKLAEERNRELEDGKKVKELAENYKIRAEKAEKLAKKEGSGETFKNSSEGELSPKDALLLAKANIDLDDVDEVLNFSKFRKISIADAIKDKTLNAILAERIEERKSANLSQIKGSKGNAQNSPERLLEDAASGNFPEKDEDIQKLVDAEMTAMKAKRK